MRRNVLPRSHSNGPSSRSRTEGPVEDQVLQLKYVKVLQMENGNVLHSWIIGLPYFFSESSAEEAEAKTTVSVH